MWPYKPITTVFLLAPIVFSFALALDVYMPVIPEMKSVLNTSQEMVQLTLSLFFLITGFGQLLLGPISDQVGRYKILLSSAVVFLISSLLCAHSSHILPLIFYRIIQGFAACGLSVTAFAIIRDAFSGKTSAMVYSFLNATLSISPILGPVIGVIIAHYFPWYGVFYFLAGLGVLTTLLSIFFVKESLMLSKRQAMTFKIFKNYATVCRSLTFWAYTLPAVAGVSAFFTLFSMTPYIIQALGQPRSQIGLYFGLAGGAFLAGSIISGLIIQRLGTYKTSLIGVILIFISGCLLVTIQLLEGLSLFGFFLPCMIATFGCALTAGSGAGGAMEPFSRITGAASAMFGALELGGSAVIGSIATLFPLTTALPLAITILITSSLSFIVLQKLK